MVNGRVQGVVIPRLWQVRDDIGYLVVSEDCGPTLAQLGVENLTPAQREQAVESLRLIHGAGVLHGGESSYTTCTTTTTTTTDVTKHL